MYKNPRHVVATVGGKILLGVFIEGKHFYHIAINEVYGSLELTTRLRQRVTQKSSENRGAMR